MPHEQAEAEELRSAALEIAEAIAPGWERRREFVERVCAPIGQWMVGALAPQPGDTVLELAAGAGDLGYGVARRLGEQGRLVTSDFSPAMLEVARRRAAELGVTGVDFRLIDAERIELEADSVDGVLCRLGYMLTADPAAALAETRRVLRPGGRLALAVWGPLERNPFFAAVVGSLVRGGHIPLPGPGMPGPFSMDSAERTRGLLDGVGFEQVRVEEVPVRFRFADLDEYLAITADTSGPIAIALCGLGEDDRDAVGAELRGAFAPFADAEGYELPGVALAALAS